MWRVTIAAMLAAAPMMSATAQEYRGFYVGADLGQSMLKADQAELDAAVVSAFEDLGVGVLDGQSSLRDEDLTYSVTLGFQVFPYLAVEAAWMDLGSSRYKANGSLTVGEGQVQIDAGAKGPAVSVLGILPFSDVWSVYARVGALFADLHSSIRLEIDEESASGHFSDKTTEFLFGAGLGFSRGPWTTRLDYQRITDVGDDDALGEADVDRVTLSAIYHF
jgi:hypothetical protein